MWPNSHRKKKAFLALQEVSGQGRPPKRWERETQASFCRARLGLLETLHCVLRHVTDACNDPGVLLRMTATPISPSRASPKVSKEQQRPYLSLSSKNACHHCARQTHQGLRSLLRLEIIAILLLEYPTVDCLHFVSISWPIFLIFLKILSFRTYIYVIFFYDQMVQLVI